MSLSRNKITDEQLAQEIESGLTLREIADKYGMHVRSVESRSSKLSRKGMGHGRNKNVTDFVPEGYLVKGTSTYVDEQGKQIRQWIKTDIDKERQVELLKAAIDSFCSELPREEPVTELGGEYEKALCLYPVFDMHIGALAHKHECGESYDTKEAERIMNGFFDISTSAPPRSERAVLLIGGDMLHSDGLEAVTPASGHVLDQDSRYAKLVYVAIRATRRAIRKLLLKHKNIELQVIEGNHDQSGMIWLRAAMAAFYEDEPRVTVDVSPRVTHHTQFGKNFLIYHHGHVVKKPEQLLMSAVADWKEDFGKSEYVYAHVGHWHHQQIIETSLGIVENHGTMAAKDAYSARGGYRAQRRASVIVYDPEFGEVGRFTFRPEMLK